ncbi:30S ribosomal protein S13 [Patescibacteria group bacterium]|nr:30S ribosomal protein S13 [Patescibacteria group bacterium]MBU1200169.1 30S ribosomal protein S13 [Patescibacteria group bacterium]MBU1256187.1 30S ribosomal protein S13 [Patescibacteria group bacterium]MBU1457721.1 30S ribosomal protein S13 [Patescibacteria group bacterium]
MPRISGVNIPEQKPVKISLTYIFGIGKKTALDMLKKLSIRPELRAKDLTSDQILKLQNQVKELVVEGELKRTIRNNIEILKRIKSYRGLRHSMGLPSKGQRTRTNARTKKGKKKTVGAMTKDTRSKMETK